MSWGSVLSSSLLSAETSRGDQSHTADAQTILEFKILLLILWSKFLKGDTCFMWEIQVWDNYGYKLQLGSTFCYPFHTQANNDMVWNHGSLSSGKPCNICWRGEGCDHQVLHYCAHFYLPMSLLNKAPPWQFSELLWTQQMFRNLTAIIDNEEAKKCLNILKHSKCLKVELVLIWR